MIYLEGTFPTCNYCGVCEFSCFFLISQAFVWLPCLWQFACGKVLRCVSDSKTKNQMCFGIFDKNRVQDYREFSPFSLSRSRRTCQGIGQINERGGEERNSALKASGGGEQETKEKEMKEMRSIHSRTYQWFIVLSHTRPMHAWKIFLQCCHSCRHKFGRL